MSEVSDLLYAARCYRCIPESFRRNPNGTAIGAIAGSVAIYEGLAWANGGEPPQVGFTLGNPDENWSFGDPGTGEAFGAPI